MKHTRYRIGSGYARAANSRDYARRRRNSGRPLRLLSGCRALFFPKRGYLGRYVCSHVPRACNGGVWPTGWLAVYRYSLVPKQSGAAALHMPQAKLTVGASLQVLGRLAHSRG